MRNKTNLNNNLNNNTHITLNEDLSLVKLLEDNDINFDNETENEPWLFQNSPYYHTHEFCRLLDSKRDAFIILSLNCQSLHAKFEYLRTYLESYNNYKIGAVCLQETWLAADSDLSLLQHDGYNLISVGKSCSAHGGVAIYLHENFNFKIIDHGMSSDIWDGQIFEFFEESALVTNNK